MGQAELRIYERQRSIELSYPPRYWRNLQPTVFLQECLAECQGGVIDRHDAWSQPDPRVYSLTRVPSLHTEPQDYTN